MNTSAPSRPTISTTLISSGWCAPAWNTASCPAPAYGVLRTPSLAPFPLAPTILSAQKNLLPLARPFLSPVREPSNNGSSSAVSAYLNRSPEYQPRLSAKRHAGGTMELVLGLGFAKMESSNYGFTLALSMVILCDCLAPCTVVSRT